MPPAALVRMTARIAHASEDADGEGHFLRGISLIKMHAALHGGDRDAACVAKNHLAGVSDRGRLREGRNLGVGDAGGAGEGVGECAQAGAEDEPDLRAECGALQNQLRGGVGEGEGVCHSSYAMGKHPLSGSSREYLFSSYGAA